MPQDETQQKLEVAISAQKEGNLEKAKLLYKSIIADDPTCAHAHHNLSIITASEDDIPSTLKHLEQARRIDPSVLQFWMSSFNVYIRLEEWKKLLAKSRRTKEIWTKKEE